MFNVYTARIEVVAADVVTRSRPGYFEADDPTPRRAGRVSRVGRKNRCAGPLGSRNADFTRFVEPLSAFEVLENRKPPSLRLGAPSYGVQRLAEESPFASN